MIMAACRESRIGNVKLLLERLGDVPGADAASAYLDALHRPVADGFDLLEIRMPGAAGLVMGVADVVPEARAFTAYFAYF